jgi:hypothetical protein
MVAVSTDGKYFMKRSEDSKLKLWSIETFEELKDK